jgi:hypothetical protein
METVPARIFSLLKRETDADTVLPKLLGDAYQLSRFAARIELDAPTIANRLKDWSATPDESQNRQYTLATTELSNCGYQLAAGTAFDLNHFVKWACENPNKLLRAMGSSPLLRPYDWYHKPSPS